MQKPLVSILIPVKNTENYLSECLQSICDQTYTSWEVIAVNDHSTDATADILTRFSEKDQRITILENKGSGIIEALRTAYEKSSGTFITRMDADDIMASDKLQVMTDALLTHGEQHIALGQVRYFSKNGVSDGYQRYEEWLNQLTACGNNYKEIYKECVIPSPCWMTYRKDLDACGAFTPNRYPEDYDLAFRFYENKLRCIPCDTILHHWRDYQTRTSRTSEHYAENYFIDIKLHYFLKIEHRTEQPLVVWGAGAKGKKIARLLHENYIDFEWVCDNTKKIGKNIYGTVLSHYNRIDALVKPNIIITVANQKEQIEIRKYLQMNTLKSYFFFC